MACCSKAIEQAGGENLRTAVDKLTLYEPVDYTRATNAMQDWAVRWTNQNLVASMTR
jgi:hypothetical protein